MIEKCSMSDLAPEQRLMVALIARNGLSSSDALAVVRANRMAAYRIGAHVLPPLQAVAWVMAATLELFAEIEGADK